MSHCSILFSLVNPNGVQSVAHQPKNIKRLAKALISLRICQAGQSLCWSHTPHCWKSHATAHIFFVKKFSEDDNRIKRCFTRFEHLRIPMYVMVYINFIKITTVLKFISLYGIHPELSLICQVPLNMWLKKFK